jgi:hypothetical protein
MFTHDWACNSTPGDPVRVGQGIRINCVLPPRSNFAPATPGKG